MALLDQNGQPLRDPASAVLQRKYALAQALQKQGMDASPVVGTGNNAMQAIARALQGGIGAYLGTRVEGEAQAMSDAQKAERQQAQAQALALYSGTTPAAPMPERLGGAPPVEAPAAVPQVQQQPLGPPTGPTGPQGMYGRNASLAVQRDALLDAPPAVLASASAATAQQRSGLPAAAVYREPEAGRSEGGAWAAGLPPATGAVPALAPGASAPAAAAAPAPVAPQQDPDDMRRRAALLRGLNLPQGQSMAAALEQQAAQVEARRFRVEDRTDAQRAQRENLEATRSIQAEARAEARRRAEIDDAREAERLRMAKEEADLRRRTTDWIPDPANPNAVVPRPGGPQDPEVIRQRSEASRVAPTPAAPTEAERKAGSYLERMQGAEAMLSGMVRDGYNPGNMRDRVAGATPLVGNFLTSERGQQYMNAAAEWARAKLRLESGAVIGEEEAKAEARTYFPMPGDSPETIAQKQRLRETATSAIRRQAGRAGGDIPLPEPSAPAAAAGGGAAAVPPLPPGFRVVR